MLKLRRCHLSAIGNRNARFSPVAFNFTVEDAPANSIIFLENGGGKTTLAAFLYLTLYPEQAHFLLKKAKDSQTRVADYLMPGQSAFCALECETRFAGLRDRPTVRVIGQILQRRDASDRSPVPRHFFTFLPCPGMSFDDLPVHGINGRKVSLSIDEFRAWLKEQRAKFPAAELWEGTSLEEYMQKLREIHAEPDLVRVQVELNKREGGIDDHFKEHCADSRRFVHTFLDLALQSERSEKTAGVLGTFLSEWVHIGYLEDETVFCEDFALALASLSDAQSRWKKADENLQACRLQAGGLWRALKRKKEDFDRTVEETKDLLSGKRAEAAEAKREVDNAYHHSVSYELEWLELCTKEAAAEAENAEREWKEARRSHHLATLAVSIGDIERHRRDLEAKRKILEEKQAELRPVLERLHSLGAALVNGLALAQNATQRDLQLGSNQQTIRKDQQQDLERRCTQIAVERSECERALSDVRTFLERRRYQRDQLAELGLLEPNERAEDGRVRWKREGEKERTNLSEQRAALAQVEQRLSELSSERLRIEREHATAERLVAETQSLLNDAKNSIDAIAGNDFVLAHFGEGFDPFRHGAKENLLQKQSEVFRSILNLQLDLALLERHRKGIEKYQVLPPARDVEVVLHRLTEAGIEAVAGLKYLSEAFHYEEAERLIQNDPSKYAGILIAQRDWHRIPTLAWPEVTQPVEISLFPESITADANPQRQIVLPIRPAFDKSEARRRSLKLDDELTGTRRQLESKKIEYDGLADAVNDLVGLLERFGDGKLAAFGRELAEKQRHLEALQSRATELQKAIGTADQAKVTARKRELGSLDRLKNAIDPALVRVDAFIREFEEKTAEMKDRDQQARDRLSALELEESKTIDARSECDAALGLIQEEIFELNLKLRNLSAEISGIVYHEGKLDTELSVESSDTLRAAYQQQRQLYEGQQDSQAQIQLAAAQQVLQSKQKQFSEQLNGESEADVHALAASSAFIETKLREEATRAAQMLERAVQNHADKRSERERARKAFRDRTENAPEGGKRRFPEGEVRPTSSREALTLFNKGQRIYQERLGRKQTLDDAVRSLNDRLGEQEKRAVEYEAQQNLLNTFQDVEAPLIELPADFAAVRVAVSSTLADEKHALQDEQQEKRDRNERLRRARSVIVDPRFIEKKLSFPKRFEVYSDEELLADIDQVRADLEQRSAANRDRVAGLKQTREQLIHMMDGMADEILALLRSVEKVSRLPQEGMGAWSGKSFIRIAFHQPDPTERQIALRQLLEELIDSRVRKANQTQDTDAKGLLCLIADRTICDKRIQVQILKPTPIRTDTYENVELLRHYSGGEGVTVAILIYLTIVQLRAQSVQNSHRIQDAGFLLLDNPFGKCNRPDLVEMQVHLAEQLKVQLIVLTGLKEPVIMMSYPRRIRLVNDILNRVTGAKHIRVEDSEGSISGVNNVRRFSLSGA